LFVHLEDLYGKYIREGFGPIRDRWLSYADIMGKPIKIVFGNDIQKGVTVDIDEDGALLLRDDTGAVRRIIAGDASVMNTMQ
jgi:BirA family biotin operon repressor/biotin-[acetyl-CoA-carboxylase] ligase